MEFFCPVDILILVFNAFDTFFLHLFHAKIGQLFTLSFSLLSLPDELTRYFENLSFALEKLEFNRRFRQNISFFNSFIFKAIDSLFISVCNGFFIFISDFLVMKLDKAGFIIKVI